MFASANAPHPHDVAAAIAKLFDTPKGTRRPTSILRQVLKNASIYAVSHPFGNRSDGLTSAKLFAFASTGDTVMAFHTDGPIPPRAPSTHDVNGTRRAGS